MADRIFREMKILANFDNIVILIVNRLNFTPSTYSSTENRSLNSFCEFQSKFRILAWLFDTTNLSNFKRKVSILIDEKSCSILLIGGLILQILKQKIAESFRQSHYKTTQGSTVTFLN